MRNLLFGSFLISIALSSCSSSISTSNNSRPDTDAVVWQQTSAEYTALCYQAFNAAKYQLNENLKNDSYNSSSKAIILDLDETVIDNSPYNAQLILENKDYTPQTWKNWVEKKNATLVPGAKDFLDFATEKGFNIFFISNRSKEYILETSENLQSKGIEIQESNYLLKDNSSSKVDRRNFVSSKLDIIMLIGDNLADFTDELDKELTVKERKHLINTEFNEYFGYRYIILPNIMYGNWQKALNIHYPKKDYKKALKGY
jgi:5'-nucleotidase (lipoprotein e(P4) family)